jgi:hypothetical protein
LVSYSYGSGSKDTPKVREIVETYNRQNFEKLENDVKEYRNKRKSISNLRSNKHINRELRKKPEGEVNKTSGQGINNVGSPSIPGVNNVDSPSIPGVNTPACSMLPLPTPPLPPSILKSEKITSEAFKSSLSQETLRFFGLEDEGFECCYTLTLPDGIERKGGIVKSEQSLFCITTYPNGERHEGYIHNYRYCGPGRCISSEGDVYEGFFAEGVLDGLVKCTNPSGNTISGDFHNGKFIGNVTYKSAESGIMLEGPFVNGKINGPGKCTLPDGNSFNCIFRDGKIQDDA